MGKDLDEGNVQQSGYAFNNVLHWKDVFRYEFKTIDGFLCIFAHYELGCFLYFPPFGKNKLSKDLIAKCFEIMDGYNENTSVSRIENVDADQCAVFDLDQYCIDEREKEYIYLREDIVTLKGDAYKSHRGDYNHFVTSHNFSYEAYVPDMKKNCMDLYDVWSSGRDQKHKEDTDASILEDNKKVHKVIIDDIDSLGVFGRVVKISGEIKGYTFGYLLNNETFCVLLEIVDLSYRGLSTFIFSRLCEDPIIENYKFVYVIGDFGLPNIKVTKESYKPCQVLPIYTVSKRV